MCNDESEKRRIIFNNILTSFNQWRTEQILKLIESQCDVLNDVEVKLFEQNASMEIINHIQQTIKKIREDNAYLK